MTPDTPMGNLYFKNGKKVPIIRYMDGLGCFNITYFATPKYTYACRTHYDGNKPRNRFYRLIVNADDSLRAEEVFDISRLELAFDLT